MEKNRFHEQRLLPKLTQRMDIAKTQSWRENLAVSRDVRLLDGDFNENLDCVQAASLRSPDTWASLTVVFGSFSPSAPALLLSTLSRELYSQS